MKGKSIVTLALLVFVAVSTVYLVVNETRPPLAPGDQAVDGRASAEGIQDAPTPDRQLIVYYFHGNTRCNTCRTIEAFTGEAITTGFPEDLKSGRVAWKVVNIDEPGNAHFVEDFDLTTKSVVLVDVRRGQRGKWTNLDKIWGLTRNKDAFINYITENTNKFLAGNNG